MEHFPVGAAHVAHARPLPAPTMLLIGTHKTDTFLEHLPESYLLIDDGPVIDRLILPKRRKVTRLDFSYHSFNPLRHMDYLAARRFVQILDAVFPEGESTLTRKYGNLTLLKALLDKPRSLARLIPRPDPKDTGAQDAYQKVETLLLSPVLRHFLTSPTARFPWKGIILARLDRAELGDFDCFVLGNLLAAYHPGPVVITDFGFYAIPQHIQLIRQGRLIAGVNFLKEVPGRLANHLLLMPEKIPCRTTFEDAETLASFAGIVRGTNRYDDFVDDCVRTP